MRLEEGKCSPSSVRHHFVCVVALSNSFSEDMISHDVLPEKLLAGCLDVLRTLSASERDLILVIVEVIHELRDPPEEEGSVSMRRVI